MESKSNQAKSSKVSNTRAKKSLHPRHSRAPPVGLHKSSSQKCEKSAENMAGKWRKKAKSRAELSPPPKIWDAAMDQLVIRPHDLLMMRADLAINQPPTYAVEKELPFVVRKRNPHGNRVTMTVLRPAPSNAVLQPTNAANYAGPRFDEDGNVVTHSLLGSFEDFKKMALEKGEFEHLFLEKQNPKKEKLDSNDINLSSSLKTWRRRIVEWRETENRLSHSVGRPVKDLVMNTADIYPYSLQERLHVNKHLTADLIGDKRNSSKFWKQRDCVGSESTGLHVTLKKSDKGDSDVADMEHTDVPECIEREKGGNIKRSYPAYYTNYLTEQKEKVKDTIHILDPYHPLLKELQVIGEGVSGSEEEDLRMKSALHQQFLMAEEFRARRHAPSLVTTSPQGEENTSERPFIKGPALLMGGKVYTWEGSEKSKEGFTEGIVSVLFDGSVHERIVNYLDICNVGTTAVHFEWSKVTKPRLEELPVCHSQRFYFTTEGGVICPGDTLRLPVIFRSGIGGVFRETWKFHTCPILSSGADILVSLKSVISVVPIRNEDFDVIERDLHHNIAVSAAKEAVENVLHSVHSPTPQKSPSLESMSEEKEFQNRFPKMMYHTTTVKEMETFYSSMVASLDGSLPLSRECTIHNVKQALTHVLESDDVDPEDDGYIPQLWYRHDCFHTFNYLCESLQYTWTAPVNNVSFENYKLSFSILQCQVDLFVDMATVTAQNLGLPMRDGEEELVAAAKKSKPKKSITAKKKKEIEKAVSPGPGLKPDDKLKTSPSRRSPRSSSAGPQTKDNNICEEKSETFIPIAVEKTSKDRMDQYRDRLYLMAYDIIGNAVTQMSMLLAQREEKGLSGTSVK